MLNILEESQNTAVFQHVQRISTQTLQVAHEPPEVFIHKRLHDMTIDLSIRVKVIRRERYVQSPLEPYNWLEHLRYDLRQRWPWFQRWVREPLMVPKHAIRYTTYELAQWADEPTEIRPF